MSEVWNLWSDLVVELLNDNLGQSRGVCSVLNRYAEEIPISVEIKMDVLVECLRLSCEPARAKL